MVPSQNLPRYNVSYHLFGNTLLQNYIKANGSKGKCHYTECEDIVMPFDKIVQYINVILENYFCDPKEDNLGVALANGCISIDFYEFDGFLFPKYRLAYDDFNRLFKDNGFIVHDEKLREDIVDAYKGRKLVQKDIFELTEAEERILSWEYISDNAIKMNQKGMTLHDMTINENCRLFELLQAIQFARAPLLKKMEHIKLYRCVNYEKSLTKVLPSDLASPPIEFTKNLRMSTKGTSFFYASLDEETAKKEAISEASDKYTYVGVFETLHGVNVLDLREVPIEPSIFDFEERDFSLLSFLKQFSNNVSKPIKNNSNSPKEYIPTQLMTYYFQNCLKLYNQGLVKKDLDGILYRSSKSNKDVNVVLFFNNEDCPQHLKLLEYFILHDGKCDHHIHDF